MATPLYLSSLFSFCEGTVGTYAHPWRCVHKHHPHYSDVGSFVYGSRQKLGSKLGSKLTVEKKSYKWSPSKNTSTFPHNHREGALFWKSILFGIFLTWQPWFQSHFGYLFPEDLHANTEHPKNTVLYWKDAHKVNCSLVLSPFWDLWEEPREETEVLKTRNPEASGISWSWDNTLHRSRLCFLWRISAVPSQMLPKILREKNRPSGRQ